MDRKRASFGQVLRGSEKPFSAFIFLIGTAAHSVSMRADAVNNLSDAMTSLVTIIGARRSEREPDRKHPFGYGRVETLSALFIGILTLYAGVTELLQPLRRIGHGEANDYSPWMLSIVAAAILVKILMGIYTWHRGSATSPWR